MGEVVQRRQQFAPGQVAGGAEDDQCGWRYGQALEPGRKRVLGLEVGGGLARGPRSRRPPPPGPLAAGFAGLTACPPNWLRSAASTRSAKSPLPRERKRAYSDAVVTGVGPAGAVASAIVQRPSPESSV